MLRSKTGHPSESPEGSQNNSDSAPTLAGPVTVTLPSSLAYRRIADWLLPSRTLKRRVWPLALGLGYIILIALLGGLRSDHILVGFLAFLDIYNEKTRAFLKSFFPFILTGAIYDFMRYFYWQGIRGHIHVSQPYLLDLRLFGISQGPGILPSRVTPNEFFQLHHGKALDLLCGFAYLFYIAEYLITAFILFFRGKLGILRVFGACFLCVNLLGFLTYFIYPAAPPWYVSQYGLGPARLDVHPSPAAAHRFDQLLGTHFFDEMYGRGIDVYGAYPSLHVTYPLLVAWTCFQVRELHWFRAPAIAFYLLMCLSAVYLQHHYVMDILLGTLYVLLTLILARFVFFRRSWTLYGLAAPARMKSPAGFMAK